MDSWDASCDSCGLPGPIRIWEGDRVAARSARLSAVARFGFPGTGVCDGWRYYREGGPLLLVLARPGVFGMFQPTGVPTSAGLQMFLTRRVTSAHGRTHSLARVSDKPATPSRPELRDCPDLAMEGGSDLFGASGQKELGVQRLGNGKGAFPLRQRWPVYVARWWDIFFCVGANREVGVHLHALLAQASISTSVVVLAGQMFVR
jgi:hypothetical protein